MDAVDPDLVDQAIAAVTSVTGIDNVRDLRIRWIGHTLRAEVDVTVGDHLTVTQAHELAHHAEAHLLDRVQRLTAATVHASPAGSHPLTGAHGAAATKPEAAPRHAHAHEGGAS